MRGMGAKIPVRLKTRRPTCKCDICGSSFLNIQALRTHQACVHPRSKRVAYKPKTEVIARRMSVPLKKVKFVPKASKQPKPIKLVKEKSEVTVKHDVKNSVRNNVRSGFECPVCSKLFTVYFTASRHIKKNHCVNDKGEAVSPKSPELIKPLAIDQCVTCNTIVDSENHSCTDQFMIKNENSMTDRKCLGCGQEFKSLYMYETHIPKFHSDNSIFMFFPDMNKFLGWKNHIETEIEKKYIALYKKDTSLVFHCNHSETEETTSMRCPSSISLQVFPKGVQAFYYKTHYGHKCKDYVLPENYKKYLLTTLVKCTNREVIDLETNDNPLFSELRKKFEDILLNALKVDDATLKILISKVSEVSTVIKNVNEQKVMPNKSLTDDEISKILDEPQTNKRKLEESTPTPKRIKREAVAKVEPRVVHKDDKEVKSNAKNTEDAKEPNKSILSPTSFNESYKLFVDKEFKKVEKTPKKGVVKTKIGQYVPSVLQKRKDKVDDKTKTQDIIPKVDLEYVVLERENECNVLLIKI